LALPYDCNDNLVTLRRSHICAALNEYLAGKVSANDIESWAGLLEGQDGVEYEGTNSEDETASEQIEHALFVLATPSINGELNPQVARDMLNTLSSAT
jgi:hypothetical protein